MKPRNEFIPIRGCELKSSFCWVKSWRKSSSPCGVWVVIPSDSLKNLESTVHPLRGVSWKFGKADSLSNCFVHPYAGMRVVMGITTLNDFKIRSSPCGDVGWNIFYKHSLTGLFSFIPIRGCGLKYYNPCRSSCGSSPCGGVGWNTKESTAVFWSVPFIPLRGCGLKCDLDVT